MTKAESVLAARLMDEAARQFHEHGCNDMDPEYFEGLEREEVQELVEGYNAWRREGCNGEDWDDANIANIGDDEWMAYLADRLA
ncbi:MAG: hypothetical protein WAL45_17660 [Terracidiphilus sp.]